MESFKLKHISIAIGLFIVSFLIYKFIYPNPRDWYDHYLYLAKSIMSGHVDIPNLPQFYHDKVIFSGKTYLPFPPGAAFVLIPFILFSKTITQQEVSIIIGALNVSAMFILLSKFTKTKWAVILSLFLGFGTVAFWSAIVGTAWYFAQNSAFLFLTIALILHFSKKDFWSGLAFALAVMCRYPILFGSIFFLVSLLKDRRRLINFLIGFAPVFPIQAIYSWLRFGNIFNTGYVDVYNSYKNSFPVTTLQYLFPKSIPFNYMDIRNIVLHLFTFLIMPPIIKLNPLTISPSPFGMGIIFTSPLLFVSFKNLLKDNQRKLLTLGFCSTAIIDFLHFSQGWVQFGYRFVLDFLPFLMILLALNFKPNKITLTLLGISIFVSTWGVLQAIQLGW